MRQEEGDPSSTSRPSHSFTSTPPSTSSLLAHIQSFLSPSLESRRHQPTHRTDSVRDDNDEGDEGDEDHPVPLQDMTASLDGLDGEGYRSKADELAALIPDDTLVGGRTFAQLSLYEKKSVLVGRELDLMGMGRYQWCIFYLCGFGYFLDLCWGQAFGLVGSAIQQELGVPDVSIGNLSIAFNTGLTVGAFTWGLLVDILGRRWCFNITCLFSSVFGLLFAVPSNYGLICFFAAMIGFGVGGNIPIDATITMEFLPKNRRYLLAALSTFQPIGVVVATLIAYYLIPSNSCGATLPSCNTGRTPCCTLESNLGWRYTMAVLGCITLLIFILRLIIFTFRESPKFLLAKGYDQQALDVLHAIARFNKVPPPSLTMLDFDALTLGEHKSGFGSTGDTAPLLAENGSREKEVDEGGFLKTFGHLRGLFETRTSTYLFIMTALAYMSLFWSFSIAGYFLPLILRAKGVDTSQSISATYRSYIWIYLPGGTATLCAAALMGAPQIGRKSGMVFAAGLMGVSLAMYQMVDSLAANIGCNAVAYWCQSLYAALLYAYTPEAFPAPIRGSASGMLSTLGRISGIIAPIAAGHLYHGSSSPGVLWLSAGAAWLSMLTVACLPFDTKGKQAY